ncbi:hypothetical protein H2198_002065 [Neophaeococcomyces mojaviensis]|uniref:Uncharacterized protein n=1 Tax=Neophaeococcomyces mojaviensis TaxID=3383035 RepID=A0ACC3AFC1_9EURO|nr:hypothetical protein H2198_002065 [Knufia sp. JES_112]
MEVIDTAAALLILLNGISNLPTKPPSLYLDLKGIRLGRNGSISILTLHVRPTQKNYLIDIHILGEVAFTTTNGRGVSLRSILESPTIPKVVFDIRNDSDALFSHYNIQVDGIKDLQLMELATRNSSRDLLAGLARCIEREFPTSFAAKDHWRRTKEAGIRLYHPAKGGRYEVFNDRPMSPAIKEYCTGDAAMLPYLYDLYNVRLHPPRGGGAFWRIQVREETKKRISRSRHPNYDGYSRTKIYGPWDQWNLEDAKDAWNAEIMFNALGGNMMLNDDDEWVPAP